MGQLPTEFPGPTAPLVNYSFEDIASGLTYVTYYGNTVYDSSNNLQYQLIGNPQVPDEPSTSQLRNSDNTHTFDVTFKVARLLRGDCNVIVPFFSSWAGATAGPDTTVHVSLFHYDGSTETQIGSTVDKTLTGNTSVLFEMLNAIIENSTDYHFAVGHILRLKVRIVTGSATNANASGGISHDSVNSTFTGSEGGDCRTKVLSVIVPYRNDT